jgi:hypothetical protein
MTLIVAVFCPDCRAGLLRPAANFLARTALAPRLWPSRPTNLPIQRINLPLIRPIFRFDYQPGALRIQPHIFPFFAIRFRTSQQMIEKFFLPRKIRQTLPANQLPRPLFPLSDKIRQILCLLGRGRSKEMNMIRHHYITPDPPTMNLNRIFPGAHKNLINPGSRQNRGALIHAYGDKEKRSPITFKNPIQAMQMFSLLWL